MDYKEKMLIELKAGKKVVCGDKFIDWLESKESEYKLCNHLRSIPNPNRYGLLDKYEAWIS